MTCMTQNLLGVPSSRPAQTSARGKATHHSPPADGLPSLLPPLASRFAFWPAAAEAKLDGRLDGMVGRVPRVVIVYRGAGCWSRCRVNRGSTDEVWKRQTRVGGCLGRCEMWSNRCCGRQEMASAMARARDRRVVLWSQAGEIARGLKAGTRKLRATSAVLALKKPEVWER